MSNIVDLEAHICSPAELSNTDQQSYESFLLNEGLEFLANFKSIDDPAKRAAIALLVRTIAHSAEQSDGFSET